MLRATPDQSKCDVELGHIFIPLNLALSRSSGQESMYSKPIALLSSSAQVLTEGWRRNRGYIWMVLLNNWVGRRLSVALSLKMCDFHRQYN